MKNFITRGNAGDITVRAIADTRKPLYIVQILDTSGSMEGESTVVGEDGSVKKIKKIDQLNEGMKLVIKSLKEFEDNNVLYRVFFQVIELNSYGKALFPEFMPISGELEEVKFEADGCTCLGNSLSTLKTYISPKYMPGYNKALSVILMSDGQPTDVNGFVTDKKGYETVIDSFKSYLAEMDYARNVDLYSIAVGDDACEEMLKYFSGDERFFLVSESESIADKLDFVTRQTLAHHTTVPVNTTPANIPDDVPSPDGTGNADPDGTPKPADTNDNDGTAYSIDITKCKKDKCMECVDKCPKNAIFINSGMIVIDPVKCDGCGVCVNNCRYTAIAKGLCDSDLDDLLG